MLAVAANLQFLVDLVVKVKGKHSTLAFTRPPTGLRTPSKKLGTSGSTTVHGELEGRSPSFPRSKFHLRWGQQDSYGELGIVTADGAHDIAIDDALWAGQLGGQQFMKQQ